MATLDEIIDNLDNITVEALEALETMLYNSGPASITEESFLQKLEEKPKSRNAE